MINLKSVQFYTQRFTGFLLWVARPWVMAGVAILLFCGMKNGMGLRYVPTELDFQVQEKLMVVQQKPGLVDIDSVRRLDDLLLENGWVDEIIH